MHSERVLGKNNVQIMVIVQHSGEECVRWNDGAGGRIAQMKEHLEILGNIWWNVPGYRFLQTMYESRSNTSDITKVSMFTLFCSCRAKYHCRFDFKRMKIISEVLDDLNCLYRMQIK